MGFKSRLSNFSMIRELTPRIFLVYMFMSVRISHALGSQIMAANANCLSSVPLYVRSREASLFHFCHTQTHTYSHPVLPAAIPSFRFLPCYSF